MFLDSVIWLFFFLTGYMDPATVKKRHLKQLAKEISRNRYSQFYKPRDEEVTGALGKFLYEIYKGIAPAQVYMQNAAQSTLLKQIVVESFLDKSLDEVQERLTESVIEERARSIAIPVLRKSLEADLDALSAAFDPKQIKIIDQCYNDILAMTRLLAFDFFTLLRKFDPRMAERDFFYQPKFKNVFGEYLLAEIKDFLEIAFGVDPEQNWNHILQILKSYRNGAVVIEQTQWDRILLWLRDVRRSGILELIVRHLDRNPYREFRPKISNEHIAGKYLEAKQTEIKRALDKIIAVQKTARRADLMNAVFGGAKISRAQYYTEEAGRIYTAAQFDGFVYAAAIGCLMSFVLDTVKTEIRDLCDLLLIRGKWIQPEFARETSNHFHLLMEQGDKLVAFDESFSELGVNGSRLTSSIFKVDRDKSQRRLVTHILNNANEEALELINTSLRSVAELSGKLKAVLEDRRSTAHTLIINWQELERVFTTPLTQYLATVCAKLDAFITLMLFLTNKEAETAEK